MSFAESLQEKLGVHKPSEVDELILDDLYKDMKNFTSDHKKTLEQYKHLIHLSLNGLGLNSLANFPKIDALKILELRQNNLTGVDFLEIRNLYPNLYKINLGANPIKSLDVFKAFDDSKIIKIEMSETEAANVTNYRYELFKIIKGLETVNGKNKLGEDVDSTINDEVGDELYEGEEYDSNDEDDEDYEDDDEEFHDDLDD